MNRKSLILLVLIIIGTILVGFLSTNGLSIGKYEVQSLFKSVQLGLDLRGGVYAVYEAKNANIPDFDIVLGGAIEKIRNRLDSKGYTEATISKQGKARIRIEIPEVKDPNELLSIIGKPGKLEFVGPDNKVIIEGKDVKIAKPGYGEGNSPVVNFELNASGTDKFAKATVAFQGQIIKIILDGKEISSPQVSTVIPNGKGEITGSKDIEEAKNLAMLITSGALPLDLNQLEVRTISATLGVDALSRSVLAGIIGFIIVAIFMLVYYRLPGLVADISLCIYIFLVILAITIIPGAQLSLPGVAGIILGIGMAVDANIIIFERVKDELRSGKSLRSSVDLGFSKAFSAIFDSNLTTIIAAVVLMIFGTGPIKGFAIVLTISVVLSMFTAITVTRYLLKLIMNLNIHNIKLYGA